MTAESPAELPPAPRRCGRLAIGFKVTCEVPEGHVKTEDDWHEATARTSSTQLTASYSHETEATEVIRWRPERYEIPRPSEE